MSVALSVLDPAPIFEGRTAAHALTESRALAQATEAMGYQRYWVQEHHNTPSFASVSPEVLIADLATHTRSIKLGAGGVMLPNYSPLKVAEQFATLSALHPGRIELGLGRATGADPRTSAALLGPGVKTFPTMLRMLMDWLLDASGEAPLPENHRASGIHARPTAPHPDLWLLASSAETAAFAGAMGTKLAFADFLAPGGATEALAAYRDAFVPSPFSEQPYGAVALVVLAAETEAEAQAAALPGAAWNVARARGAFIPFPSPEAAGRILDQAGPDAASAARSRSLVGDSASVAQRLTEVANTSGADELFLLTIAGDPTVRINSYRRIIDAIPA